MGPFYRVFLPSFGSSIKETCGLIDGHFDQLVPSFTGFHFSRNEGDRFGWFSMVFFLPTWALPSFTELLSKWIGFFRWWDRPYRVLPSFHRDRIQFLLCVSGIYPVLPSFTKFDRVVLGFTWFYRVLPSFTEFYWVALCFTVMYCVFTQFYLVSPSCIGLYRVLPSFTEFYWVVLCFTGMYWVFT